MTSEVTEGTEDTVCSTEWTERGGEEALAGDGRRGWWTRVSVRGLSMVALSVLFVVSAGLATGLYFGQYRVDQQLTSTAAKTVLNAASEGSVALLSYKPDSLAADLTAAKSHLTGEFLTYYSKFADDIVAPAAKDKGITTKASVVRAGVSELHPERAKVLLFINQTTTGHDRPDTAQAASSVIVGMTKVHGTWLISSFDPV